MSFRTFSIATLFLLLLGFCATQERGRAQQPEIGKDHSIVGIWTQYCENPDKPGDWLPLGTFRVISKDNRLQMVLTKTYPRAGGCYGIFNVKRDGKSWTFLSDWGNDKIGSFKLAYVSPDVYQGYPYLNGEKLEHQHNIWIRSRE